MGIITRICFYLSGLMLASGCYCNSYLERTDDVPSRALAVAVEESKGDRLIAYDEKIPERWWELFADEQLSCFIQTALDRNPTLQMAYANIQLAQANACAVRASLFPTFTWGADIAGEKLSETGLIPFNQNGQQPQNAQQVAPGGFGGIPVYFAQYETEVNFAYDFDIWNKNRNALCAAIGRVRAEAADALFAKLQLSISVAQAYYQVQINYKRREVARAFVDNQMDYLEMVQKRLRSNIDNMLTVQTAEANVSAARDWLLRIEGDLTVAQNRLKTYLANTLQETIEDIEIEDRPLPPVPLPKNIPLHLLAYRPDITAQLWLIDSAGRDIDVAKAGFYPDFNLTGWLGFQTIHLGQLFNPKSVFFNVDPAMTLPLFEGGRLRAALRHSEVNYNLAILKYNQLVLDAAKEVLDGLAILRISEQQLQEWHSRFNNQQEIYTLTAARVRHNINSDLDLLTTHGNLLAVQDQQLISLGNTIQAILALIKALGGGYETCCGEG